MTAPQQHHLRASSNPAAHPADQAAASSTKLARALEQSEAAADSVQQSADELLVINAVLKQEIPDEVQTGEVAQALQKSDDLGVTIQDAAQELTQVNEALAHEIAERVELESKLAAAKAALAQAGPAA